MKIHDYFDKLTQSSVIIYRLKDAEWNTFLNELTTDFRVSYIFDSKLQKLSVANNITAQDFFKNKELETDR